MKTLIITSKSPFPKLDGGCVAMANLIEGLHDQGHEIGVFVLETYKHPFQLAQVPEKLRKGIAWASCFVDTKINLVDAFTALINDDSYNLTRFFSPDADKALIEFMGKCAPDIVHIESLYASVYLKTIRRCTNAPIVFRSHNLEFEIWQRLAKEATNPVKKMYFNMLATNLKKEEKKLIETVDGIASISSQDLEYYKQFDKPAELIPLGMETPEVPESSTLRHSFFHLGAMDWKPNIDALNSFLIHAWKPFVEANPDAKLHLAGRKCQDYTPAFEHPSIINHGEVPVASEFMLQYGTMVVPLFAGSGIRIKIIEGSLLGIPVITTPVGIQSIEHEEGKSVLVASNWEEWISKLSHLYQNPELSKSIGKLGQAMMRRNHNLQESAEKLVKFYKKLRD